MHAQEQAAMLHAAGMLDYSSLKDRILVTTAALVAAGSSLCYSMGGWPATEPFLAGGAVGLAYQSMLQANVDSLPGSSAYSTRVRIWPAYHNENFFPIAYGWTRTLDTLVCRAAREARNRRQMLICRVQGRHYVAIT